MQMTEPMVLRSVTVAATPERAFEVFTRDIKRWWPPEHHLGEGDLVDVYMESRAGGTWGERTTDGECAWGRVLEWEPSRRVVLSWQITLEWEPEPDPERASTIEVRFEEEEPGQTRVEIEHRDFERHGEGWQKMADSVGGTNGWSMNLRRFSETLATTTS
jgi:uncharacterized protein YndB with AHSA1/START domain